MSQEEQKDLRSQELRKKLLAGGLLVVLAGVIYYQFFYAGGAPARPQSPDTARTTATTKPQPTPRPGQAPDQIVSEPLQIAFNKDIAGAGTGRNIFVFPTPTPIPPAPTPKPTPPPPPPPVTLFSVNPAGVIARTGDFTLTVFGDKIPADGQGYIDGREFPTTIVNATELKMKVPADAIQTAGNLGIQVRSKSDAKMYSNQASLNVAEPPSPQYRYIGLIVSKNGSLAVLKSQTDDEVVNVIKGQTFGRHWRVISISPQKIEIEDTNIKITHTINYTGENG
jgi:hypothetical protein